MTSNPAGSPETAAKAETNTATVAPDKGTNVPSNDSSTDLAAEIARASNPAQVKALLDKMQQPKAPSAEKPAESTSGKKPAETQPAAEESPKAEVKPEGEETPAAEEPETAETPGEETPAADADPEVDPDNDIPITALTAKKTHLRLPPETDQVGRLALAYQKRNRDWTLEQSLAAARKQLGVATPETAAAKPTEETPAGTTPKKSDLPETVEAVDAALEQLESERTKMLTDLRFDEVAKLDSAIRKMDRHRSNLEREQERSQAEQAAAAAADYNTKFDASASRAGELYDFASDPKSEGGKRMVEIEEALKQNNDPLYNSPNKPLVIAQMVARELRIPPKTAKASKTTAAAKPAQPATEKPKSVIPSGGSSTTPSTTDSQGKFAESVLKVQNLGDLKKFARQSGINLPI